MSIQHKPITSDLDFKEVAKDIVNNIESWRVNSQAKTEAALTKMVSNMNKKDAERAQAYIERSTGDIQLDETYYGYGNKRRQGD